MFAKSTLTIAAVVIGHAALFAFIGCQTDKPKTDTSAHNDTSAFAGDASGGSSASVRTAPAPIAETTPPPPGGPVSGGEPAPVRETPPPPPPPAAGSHTYTIKRGDKLSLIAKRQGVRLSDLRDANPGLDERRLRPGQKITIPAKRGATAGGTAGTTGHAAAGDAPAAGPHIIYTVKSGDALSRIARRHHVTVTQIKNLNGLTGDGLRAGQKLKIPRSQNAAAPAPAGTPGSPAVATPSTSAPPPPAAPDAPQTGLGAPLVAPDLTDGANTSVTASPETPGVPPPDGGASASVRPAPAPAP